jgi:hypothetical protein
MDEVAKALEARGLSTKGKENKILEKPTTPLNDGNMSNNMSNLLP